MKEGVFTRRVEVLAKDAGCEGNSMSQVSSIEALLRTELTEGAA